MSPHWEVEGPPWKAGKSLLEAWRWMSKGDGENWSSEEAEARLPSFTFYAIRLQAYWLVPPTPRVGFSSSMSSSFRHHQNCAQSVNWVVLIQTDTTVNYHR